MKTRWFLMICSIFLLGFTPMQGYAFDSGSTGADGAFNPTVSTTVELPEDGILNYTTVNIPSGVTVTFKKNTANTPVYMLATEDVTISGTINVSGGAASGVYPGNGGPGGHNGGYGGYIGAYGSNGLGANGGAGGSAWTYDNYYYYCYYGKGGSGGSISTNDKIAPSVGGSGGGGGTGGYSDDVGGGGGGGAGALVIASSGKVTVAGSIVANGGAGAPPGNVSTRCKGSGGGGGSAGTIRILANEIAGNGAIQATGGAGGTAYNTFAPSSGAAGSSGKIRLEGNILSRTAATSPVFTFDYPGQVFYSNAFPLLSIVSIGGVPVPADPKADYNNTDIILPSNVIPPVEVVVVAANIPAGTTVTVRAIPQNATTASTTATSSLSGTDISSTATAALSISTTRPSIIAASATFNITVASNGAPLYVEGEKVVKMRVDTELNKKSSVTYITETGREILAMNK